MVKIGLELLKQLEDIYLTTSNDEICDFIDGRLIEILGEIGCGTVIVVTRK